MSQNTYSLQHPEVWVPSTDEDAKQDIPFLLKIFKKYGPVKKILDVGCGMGRHAIEIGVLKE